MYTTDLSGRVAVVTGAGKGIGREIALCIAKCGGIPIIADIDSVAAKQTAADTCELNNGEARGVALDLRDVERVRQLFDEVHADFGHIDILVNNAGILDNSSIEELDEAHWDDVLDVNLKAAFFCSKFAYIKMKERSYGRIINISSLAGRNGGFSVGCAYAASKAGLIGMTMNYARRGAAHGITVNAVAPGTTESEMSARFTPEQLENAFANIPVRRLGKPDEIAHAVLFLASGEAGFITGAVLDINGGMKMG